MNETVTISKKEYDRLWEDSNLLTALKCHGVDNWEGYCDAVQEAEAQNEEDMNG